eukprot:Colp12_sorted_trinity150504_noHs@17662
MPTLLNFAMVNTVHQRPNVAVRFFAKVDVDCLQDRSSKDRFGLLHMYLRYVFPKRFESNTFDAKVYNASPPLSRDCQAIARRIAEILNCTSQENLVLMSGYSLQLAYPDRKLGVVFTDDFNFFTHGENGLLGFKIDFMVERLLCSMDGWTLVPFPKFLYDTLRESQRDEYLQKWVEDALASSEEL